MSDLIQEECSKCGASFSGSPELTVCPKCGERIRGSWSRSRLPLVVWIIWGFLPAALMFSTVLFGVEGIGAAISAIVLVGGFYGGPIILYIWSLALLKSPSRGWLAACLLAVPLAAVMFAINFGIAFAGCSIAGNFM